MELLGLWLFFFNCYLAVPQPTLSHSQGDSLTNPMLITAFVHVRPEGHREPRNEVGSLYPAELRSVAYSLLTLNKLLGSCNKQEKEIDVKRYFSLKIVLVQALPSLPQLPLKN